MTAEKVGMLPCPPLESLFGSSATDSTVPVSSSCEPSELYMLMVAGWPVCTAPISVDMMEALTSRVSGTITAYSGTGNYSAGAAIMRMTSDALQDEVKNAQSSISSVLTIAENGTVRQSSEEAVVIL